MTASDVASPPPDAPEQETNGRRSLVRWLGWLFIVAGGLVLLYLVYVLWFTGFETEQAQDDLEQSLLDEWSLEVDDAAAPELLLPGESSEGDAADEPNEAVQPGDAVAAIRFEKGDTGEAVVSEETLFVVEGVEVADLRRGPGRYPRTSLPGQDGNFAISGHRTTYGAPFFDLDDLEAGDRILVTDRSATEFTYEVVEQRIVTPFDIWVIGADPLGNGRPLMTITTCHPRWSDAQRLIVFAELVA